MRSPPALSEATKFPATSLLAVSAIVVTGAWWLGLPIDRLVMNFHFWPGELWRLETSALPHVDPLHLAFNVYWLWVFGTLLERVYGSIKVLGIYAGLALGSAAAEYALFIGGVGLSGVGYGLFGLLYVLSRRDERFRDAIDSKTTQVFVGWFFVCIALTVTRIMPVANVAHAVGAILGMLLGCAITRTGTVRGVCIAGLAALVAAAVVGASVGRVYVNIARDFSEQFAYQGYLALTKGKNEDAAELFRKSIASNSRNEYAWTNLGVASQRLRKNDDAMDAYRHSLDLKPNNVIRHTLAQLKAYTAFEVQNAGHWADAARLYTESLALEDGDAKTWYGLYFCQQRLSNDAEALKALEAAVSRDPANRMYKAELERLRKR